MPVDLNLQGKSAFELTYEDENWDELRRELNKMKDFMMQVAGVGQHTIGYGTTIKKRGVEIVDTITFTDGTYDYFCKAENLGTHEDYSKWQVRRITIAGGAETWADSNRKYDNVAKDYATLTYGAIPA